MHYMAGLLLGMAGMDYEDMNILIHSASRVGDKYVRLFSMSQALDILNGYHDARRIMGSYHIGG